MSSVYVGTQIHMRNQQNKRLDNKRKRPEYKQKFYRQRYRCKLKNNELNWTVNGAKQKLIQCAYSKKYLKHDETKIIKNRFWNDTVLWESEQIHIFLRIKYYNVSEWEWSKEKKRKDDDKINNCDLSVEKDNFIFFVFPFIVELLHCWKLLKGN